MQHLKLRFSCKNEYVSQLEDITQLTPFTNNDFYENHLISTTERSPDRRYIVVLLFKSEGKILSKSFTLVLKRYHMPKNDLLICRSYRILFTKPIIRCRPLFGRSYR